MVVKKVLYLEVDDIKIEKNVILEITLLVHEINEKNVNSKLKVSNILLI